MGLLFMIYLFSPSKYWSYKCFYICWCDIQIYYICCCNSNMFPNSQWQVRNCIICFIPTDKSNRISTHFPYDIKPRHLTYFMWVFYLNFWYLKAFDFVLEKLRRLKRVTPCVELLNPIGKEICKQFFSLLDGDIGIKEYVVWGALVPFMLETFGMQAPHDGASLDKVMDLLLSFPEFKDLIIPTMLALSYSCKTSMITLVDCPYTGSYPYLALACHIWL